MDRRTEKTPITSYGILLFYIDNGVRRYLLAQRRDTIEYTDFLRGRYSLQCLELYLTLMTDEERDRLTNYNFNELWDDLWVNHNSRFYKDGRAKAEAKYQANRVELMRLLRETRSRVTAPGWGFPKGKKNLAETDLQCALREFNEETKMKLSYQNLLNISASTEIFKGSNNKIYSTVYYIAETKKRIPIKKMNVHGRPTVSEEVSELAWCTVSEARKYLPEWRYKLLVDTDKRIKAFIDKK